ncbi:MAG: hypothetical protein IPK83_02100 [Planctomycetes bacterium]|nr:hypothetical protein [Planctomycetota bacterium]
MSNCNWFPKPTRKSLLILVPFSLMVAAPPAFARPNIRSSFFAQYPSAVGSAIDTVPSHAVHCGMCHFDFNGSGPRNGYGNRLAAIIGSYPNTDTGRRAAMVAIQDEDNDGDGYSNLTEITDTTLYGNTPTFPGLTPGNVVSVSNVLVGDIQNHLVPMTSVDTTPPVVTVTFPNGGQTLIANTAIIVQWTAIDTSGISKIDIRISEDNGVIFRMLARNLTQVGSTGEAEIFLPNRPTTAARIQVIATDNASNVGSDSSDAAFTVQAPPGGIAPTTLRDFDLPGTLPFDAAPLIPPDNCAACHGGYDLQVEPHFNWQGSMMSHASRDLLFEACMAIANQDAPDSGDVCIRCHTSSAWLDGRSVPTSGDAILKTDEFGVSCDLCHRMVDPIPDVANPPEDSAILAALLQSPTQFANGMLVVDPDASRRRGPFSDTVSPHGVLVSSFHREASLCGSCHDVSNPAFEKDGNGNYVPNAFDAPPISTASNQLMPIERTYSEWFHSAYNTPGGVFAPEFGGNRDYVASCQDCHMRDVTGRGCNDPLAQNRIDLPLHDMTGGTTWLLGLMPQLFPEDVNAAAVTAGVARARYMLQNAATMSLNQQDDQLVVTITNQTGHKLPTGYPEGRRMWLNVRFFDAADQLIKESAAYDAAEGELDHDAEAKIYESKPGLDELTASLVGVAPGPSFHFVLNNKIFKDNRIPPRGFLNAAFADFGGAPVGATYADGQYWDETAYAIPTGASRVDVALYYQSTSSEYVTFLRDENTTNAKGQDLFDLWTNNGRCPPELMNNASLTLTIEIPPGDIDADYDVDTDDLALFVNVLLDLETNPDFLNRSDLDGNSLADGKDIDLFVIAYLSH